MFVPSAQNYSSNCAFPFSFLNRLECPVPMLCFFRRNSSLHDTQQLSRTLNHVFTHALRLSFLFPYLFLFSFFLLFNFPFFFAFFFFVHNLSIRLPTHFYKYLSLVTYLLLYIILYLCTYLSILYTHGIVQILRELG